MPRGDGTGHLGLGPMTGRRAGFCAGYNMPGYANPIPCKKRGFGRGFGRGGGRGIGKGWRRWAGWNFQNTLNEPYTAEMSPEEELNALKSEAEFLKNELKSIQEQINSLEKAQNQNK